MKRRLAEWDADGGMLGRGLFSNWLPGVDRFDEAAKQEAINLVNLIES
jgi:hypothetical protein